MKFLTIISLALVALVLIKIKKQYRMHITVAFLLVIIIFNIVYNVYVTDSIMPFIRPTNQFTYQPEYQEMMEFPDALLPLLIKGKKIYVKDDFLYDVMAVMESGKSWTYTYFHHNSTVSYANGIGAKITTDEKLNDCVISKEMLDDFVDLGYANDMYRNTNIYSGYEYESLNYYTHYWYYNTEVAPMHIYINTDGIFETDELVWLWQPISITHEQEESEKDYEYYDETEYMFVMSKDYFDRHFG